MLSFRPLYIFLLVSTVLTAQISPPGLGSNNRADSWIAIGLNQDLDSAQKLRSFSYIGIGRESRPDDSRLFEKQAIVILNQEFYYRYTKHWQFSGALSYRRQNNYQQKSPFTEADPAFKNELRSYARLILQNQLSIIRYGITLRQEIRKFYDPSFNDWPESWQLRTRLKLQARIGLDEKEHHQLSAGVEVLLKSSFDNNIKEWSDLRYDETRLTIFYSFIPSNSKVIYSIGYMDDLVSRKNIPYLSLNFVFRNPFHKISKKNEQKELPGDSN